MKEDLILRDIDFLISEKRNNNFINYYDIGNYKFQYNDLEAVSKTKNGKTIIIYGTIVNSYDSDADGLSIINSLLESKNLFDLINNSKKMAGRFVIVYHSREGLFVLPDAASSIQVVYDISGQDLIISSNPKIIADINNYDESSISKIIKSSAEETHPLPYDMTMYDEIKFVIPNHFLDVRNRKAVRYYPISKTNRLSIDEAAEISNKLIGNIIKAYYKRYELSLPLTSGMDSRVILSICKNIINEIPTYTFYHDNFTDDTADIVVPIKLSNKYGFSYTILKDLKLPERVIKAYTNRIGKNINKSEARNAWTYYNSKFSKHKRLDGNISPLAKSNFGRDLPELMATPLYLVTKTHNYSKENYKKVAKWCRDIKKYTKISKTSKYDLFFWEHRVGKWTANSYVNSNLLTDSLNPFNCRELIETWLKVPRKNRCNGEIHKKIIEFNWPDLLDFPINPDQKFKIFYKSSFLFYIGSIIKYVLNWNRK